MKPIKALLFILLTGMLLQACTKPKPNTPLTVAQAFWTAALEGDVETAKQFLTPQSRPHFKVILQSPKDYVELGEQNISLTRAEILTQLTRHTDNRQHKTALRTILLNQQGQWLVDFNQTRDSMLGSELQSVLDQLSDTMRRTIDKGVKVMGDAVKEELQEMEQSLQEFNKKLNEELNKEMNKKRQQEQENQEQKQDFSPEKSPPETTTL